MSYLLHNRRRFYETVLPRIPDQKVRKALEEINQLPFARDSTECDVNKSSMILLSIDLTDEFKKPTYGEKLGRTVISLEEVIDQAICLEQLCKEAYAHNDTFEGKQAFDLSSLRTSKLRKLRDSLQYHRFRLID